jgi:integrase|tara:strand:+ start:149 stop:1339 length:1191 start_codon:yes stop_codon:yes gene_type:complete
VTIHKQTNADTARTQRITAALIKSLVPPPKGNRIFYDDDLTGFGIRITSTGQKAFVLNYRLNGKEYRPTIGKYPEWTVTAARKRVQEWRQQIDRGENPLEKKREERAAPTVRDLYDRFHHTHLQGRSKAYRKDQERDWKVWILPALGDKKLKDLTHEDCVQLHQDRTAKAPVAANRMIASFRKALNKAKTWQWLQYNPVEGLQLNREEPRERYLTPDEIRRLFDELQAREGNGAADAIKFIALTGCRKGEALQTLFTDFNAELTEWTKPARITKQRKRHRIPLPLEVTELLQRRREIDDFHPFLGTSGRPLLDVKNVWQSVRQSADIRDVTVHDLRHSIATYLASNGTSLETIGAVLGHSQVQTTRRYAHIYQDRLATELQRYSNAIKEITSSSSD